MNDGNEIWIDWRGQRYLIQYQKQNYQKVVIVEILEQLSGVDFYPAPSF